MIDCVHHWQLDGPTGEPTVDALEAYRALRNAPETAS